MIFGLHSYLTMSPLTLSNGSSRLLYVGDNYYTAGFWVALAAHARANNASINDLIFLNTEKYNYASAIRLPVALGDPDNYPYQRSNEGINYAGLVLLDSRDKTDNATAQINNCIRSQCNELNIDSFVKELCEVVGDLHDNVWSHGRETGFSMFQKLHSNNPNDVEFEFALADYGIGFLRELQRVGFSEVTNCEEAIKWCIQEGNSSKLLKKKDEWAQSLPPDMMGNPMPNIGAIKETENHHQGLGLAKLIKLVTKYRGYLCLATGDSIFMVDSDGNQKFATPTFAWTGVSISCRFRTPFLRSAQETVKNDEIIDELLNYLGG